MTLGAALSLAAVVVGTWNGEWFPSGRAEHRGTPQQEARTIAAAGDMFREALAKADPAGTNDLILCFNEMRGPKAAAELCAATGRTNLTVAIVTGYRRRDRFDMQQDAIATTLPVAVANWSLWKHSKGVYPPRGYAHAEIVLSPAVTATVYAVHLKSNYGATTAEIAESNRRKRTVAIRQLIDQEKPKRGKYRAPVVIAGDFNADAWKDEFADEEIFRLLAEAKFANPVGEIPEFKRVTYPGHGKFGGSALDYVYLRGLKAVGAPWIYPAGGISDHNPVFVTVVGGSPIFEAWKSPRP